MSLFDKIDSTEILPNQIGEELLRIEVCRNSCMRTLYILLENNWREENKEEYFEKFTDQKTLSKQQKKKRIIKHFGQISSKIKKHYGPSFTQHYIDEIIDRVYPAQQAHIIKTTRMELKKQLLI